MSQVVVVIGGGALSARAVARRRPTTPSSSPPTAGSTMPWPPACDRRCWSAISTASRRTGRMWAYAHELEHRRAAHRQGLHRHRAGARCAPRPTRGNHLLRARRGRRTLRSCVGHAGSRSAIHALARFETVRGVLGDTDRARHARRPQGHARSSTAARPFSLLALHGPCHGVNVSGARWPLTDADARAGRARGDQQRSNGACSRSPSPTASSRWWSHEASCHRRSPFAVARRRRCWVVAASSGRPVDRAGRDHTRRLRLVPDEGHTAERRARRVHRRRPASTSTVVTAGDAGTMVTKAVLTAGNPEGDVMWGVDNTLLSAARGEVFTPTWQTICLRAVRQPTAPVDFGDVCVNYDIAWFTEHDVEPPTHVSTTASTRSTTTCSSSRTRRRRRPGLAFLLATIAQYGDEGWQQYWNALRANGVEVVDGWDERVLRAVQRRGGLGRRPAAGRQLRHQPARRGDLRRPAAAPTRRRRCRVARASGRSSSPACCAAPTHDRRGPQARRLPDSRALPARTAAHPVRLPGRTGRGAARGVHQVRRRARRSAVDGPGHDRRQPPEVAGRVDRRSCCAEPRLPGGSAPAMVVACRQRRWRVFYAWPVATLLATRGATAHRQRRAALAGTRRTCIWFTFWQAAVSTVLDAGRRVRARLRPGPLQLPGRDACCWPS